MQQRQATGNRSVLAAVERGRHERHGQRGGRRGRRGAGHVGAVGPEADVLQAAEHGRRQGGLQRVQGHRRGRRPGRHGLRLQPPLAERHLRPGAGGHGRGQAQGGDDGPAARVHVHEERRHHRVHGLRGDGRLPDLHRDGGGAAEGGGVAAGAGAAQHGHLPRHHPAAGEALPGRGAARRQQPRGRADVRGVEVVRPAAPPRPRLRHQPGLVPVPVPAVAAPRRRALLLPRLDHRRARRHERARVVGSERGGRPAPGDRPRGRHLGRRGTVVRRAPPGRVQRVRDNPPQGVHVVGHRAERVGAVPGHPAQLAQRERRVDAGARPPRPGRGRVPLAALCPGPARRRTGRPAAAHGRGARQAAQVRRRHGQGAARAAPVSYAKCSSTTQTCWLRPEKKGQRKLPLKYNFYRILKAGKYDFIVA